MAASQILQHEYAIMASCIKALTKTPRKRSVAVHDLRVSARRFRSAARLFKSLLQPSDIKVFTDTLKLMSDQLSSVRDCEVWLAFLDSVVLPGSVRDGREFGALHDAAKVSYRQSREDLKACLSGDAVQNLLKLAPKVIDKQIPRLKGSAPKCQVSPFVANRLVKPLGLLEAPMPGISQMSSTALHTLRKSVRQLRYWAEFSEPILEGPVVALTVRLKEASDGLGAVHDMDVHMEYVDSENPGLSDLYDVMLHQREQGLERFRKRWKALCRKSSRCPLNAFLKDCVG
ncbi:MAG: CHAD domain-containing protein [Verrucomicrobia bacterium]|jgi:CHAD domain-containing protein|nr:CHAD domain-containing protein [Verrucomicrobiota bacterium]